MLGTTSAFRLHVRFMLTLLHIKAQHRGQQVSKTIRSMMQVGQTHPYGSSQLAMLRQWGGALENNTITLPLTASNVLSIIALHKTSVKQVYALGGQVTNNSVYIASGSTAQGSYAFYIAICN